MEYPLSNTYGARSALFLQSADDYHRQRHRVNKKLGKLRRSLKIQTKDTKNYAEKEKVSSITNENYEMDSKFGDVLLYQIERDLLYAQETRLLLDVYSSKSKEKFLISKYKKALQNAKKLLEITKNEQDYFRILELLSYTAIIEGSLAISKRKYSNALYAFSVARCSLQFLYQYEELSSQFTKELYLDIIDSVIDPALKVSALQANSNRNPDLVALSKEQVSNNSKGSYLNKAIELIKEHNASFVTPVSENETPLIRTITWSTYNAEINSEDVSFAIMKVKENELKIVDSDAASYDSTLISYQDAINTHIQEMERSKYDSEDNENQEQHIILTYLKYNYLLLRIRRDITLLNAIDEKIGNKKNSTRQRILELLRDILKVNEGIIFSIEEIKELPGVSNDDDIMSSLSTLGSYYQINKLIKLSKAYLISNKYVEALGLINEAKKLIGSISPFVIEFEGNSPKNSDLDIKKEEIKTTMSKLYVLASYFKSIESNKLSTFIIDNIDKFPEIPSGQLINRIAPLKATVIPVNVKPVLFDIAYNYISYGDVDSVTNKDKKDGATITSDEVESDKKKTGFFGLFGR